MGTDYSYNDFYIDGVYSLKITDSLGNTYLNQNLNKTTSMDVIFPASGAYILSL
jgi:hypothetical protein